MFKELIVDAEVTALLLGATNRIKLIEREYRNMLKGYLTLLVTLNKLAVEAKGSLTCCKAQYKWRKLLVDVSCRGILRVVMHHATYHIRNILNTVILALEDTCGHTLVAMYDILWCKVLHKTTILWKLIFTIIHTLYMLFIF
jgi:hypothetical protein